MLGGAADFDQTSRRMSKAVRGNFLEATKACDSEEATNAGLLCRSFSARDEGKRTDRRATSAVGGGLFFSCCMSCLVAHNRSPSCAPLPSLSDSVVPAFAAFWLFSHGVCCVAVDMLPQLAIPDTPGVADVWRLHWEAELVKLNEEMEVIF